MEYKHYHHHHYHRGGQGSSADSVIGRLVMIILGLIAMPLVGLYMMISGKESSHKTIGAILLIVGIIIWIAASQG